MFFYNPEAIFWIFIVGPIVLYFLVKIAVKNALKEFYKDKKESDE